MGMVPHLCRELAESEIAMKLDYIWRGSTHHPERKGQRCAILTRPVPGNYSNHVQVRFEDGVIVLANGAHVKRAKTADNGKWIK